MRFPVVLNEENIEEIHALLKQFLENNRICIVKHEYIDGPHPSTIRVEMDNVVEACWTDGSEEKVRLFKKDQLYTPKGRYGHEEPYKENRTRIAFTLASFYHTWTPAPGNRNDHHGPMEYRQEEWKSYYYMTVEFREDRDSHRCEIIYRSGGKGTLHKTIFVAIPKSEADKAADLEREKEERLKRMPKPCGEVMLSAPEECQLRPPADPGQVSPENLCSATAVEPLA